MKYGNRFYMQVSRAICDEEHTKNLSVGARYLFITLNELEQRFCGRSGNDHFLRSDQQLAEDMNVSVRSIKKYKAELREYASDLVFMSKGRYVDRETKKKSEQEYTCYRILR